jgi:hypothetical protein
LRSQHKTDMDETRIRKFSKETDTYFSTGFWRRRQETCWSSHASQVMQEPWWSMARIRGWNIGLNLSSLLKVTKKLWNYW